MMAVGFILLALGGVLMERTCNWFMLPDGIRCSIQYRLHRFIGPALVVIGLLLIVGSFAWWLWLVMP